MCCLLSCRDHLFGFDDAKVRRFWGVAKHFCGIVCANSHFFDVSQLIGVFLKIPIHFGYNPQINLVFRSLIRTFELCSKILPFGKIANKICFFAHLFVPLHPLINIIR